MTGDWVPKGYEFRNEVRPVNPGEYLLGYNGEAIAWMLNVPSTGWAVILRKIEKPKQYRPFANAAEFKPHRDRWWKTKDGNRFYPPTPYGENDHNGVSWLARFENCVFDDGSPFGVEVAE